MMELLIYFSAPVFYVGVVQAAFCDRLGASVTVANLPSAAYLLGGIFPIFCAWLVPARLERKAMAWCSAIAAASMFLVCVVVFVPAPAWLRISTVIGQGLLLGISSTVTNVYLFKCLARGTTESGRAWALKFGFGLGPVAAVAGSLVAQQVLTDRLPGLEHPHSFGVLYLIAFPCLAACAWLSGRLQLRTAVPEPGTPFFTYIADCARALFRDSRLAAAVGGFFLWYVTLGTLTDLSLYTRVAVGRSPLELAGLVMALRFGCKALAGFGVGALAQRYGPRSAMIATVVLVGLGALWPFLVSGPLYMATFGLMGAGELGGVYFANYVIAISTPSSTTRNLALLLLVGPLSSAALALHGRLTDVYGFHASFGLGVISAVLAWLLLWRMTQPRANIG